MRTRRLVTLAIALVAALSLTACGGGGDTSGDEASPTAATGTEAAAPETGEPVSGEITITAPVNAATTGYAETAITAPAGEDLVITFDNQDSGVPHNVQIFEATETTGTPIWAPKGGKTITGPDIVEYGIPALDAGAYTFNCVTHATSMIGTLTVQ